MLVSVFSMVAISYDRFLAIAFPSYARLEVGRACRIIAVIWTLAAIIAAPLIPAATYMVHFHPRKTLQRQKYNHIRH